MSNSMNRGREGEEREGDPTECCLLRSLRWEEGQEEYECKEMIRVEIDMRTRAQYVIDGASVCERGIYDK